MCTECQETKTCSCCNVAKPLSEFWNRCAQCKLCMRNKRENRILSQSEIHEKTCNTCHCTKSSSEFLKDRNICKSCRSLSYRSRVCHRKERGMCTKCASPTSDGYVCCDSCRAVERREHDQHKQLGLCQCGKQAKQGMASCSDCLQIRKHRRESKKRLGLCPSCNADVSGTKQVYCDDCRRAASVRFIERKRTRSTHGECRCGEKLAQGKTLCANCLHVAAIRSVSYYKRVRNGECGTIKQLQLQLRGVINSSFRRKHYSKGSKTHELLGCSYEEAILHLGEKPEGNYHIDHICPCSQARTKEEVIKLQHISNFRWMPASSNCSRQDKWTEEGEAMCRKLLGREWLHEANTIESQNENT